jgi:SAM-dependent methyltransferase
MKLIIYEIPLEIIISWVLKYQKKRYKLWLDLGCGDGEFIRKINFYNYDQGVGVDVFKNKNLNLPNNFDFKTEDIKNFLDNNNKKIDLVSLFEVLEHFKYKDAVSILNRVISKAENVILSTPRGFLKQNKITHPWYKENPWQWHKSGFDVSFFEKYNFFIIVLKNMHIRKFGIFDGLLIFKGNKNYKRLKNYLLFKSFVYYMNPIHLFRLIRKLIQVKIYKFENEK